MRAPIFVRDLLIVGALSIPISSLAVENTPTPVEYQLDDSGWAEWRLDDRYVVSAMTACDWQTRWGFWPYANCRGAIRAVYKQADVWGETLSGPPLLIGEKAIEPDIVHLEGDRLGPRFDALIRRINARSRRIAFNKVLMNHDSAEVWGFRKLRDSSRAIVEVQGQEFILEGFRQFAANDLEAKHQALKGEIFRERMVIVAIGLAYFLGFALGAVLILMIARYLIHNVPGWVGGGIKGILKRWTHWRIHNIAIEETVRRVTRGGLESATDQETTALRRQISDALEAGDTELATTLNSILRRLEAGRAGE